MIHSILMIGQSNMAGRGKLGEVEPINNPKIKVMRNGRWQPMFYPVNPDRPWAGHSLAESFADEYSKAHPDVEVGLIPCADGGTPITMWAEGSILFDHAVFMTKLAKRTSEVAAIIWHQGEGDCRRGDYPLYEERLTAFIKAFRRAAEVEDIPFIIGGLGDFLIRRDDYELENYTHINDAMKGAAAKLAGVAFVSAEGLESNPDNLHFSSASLRELGVRYYRAFEPLEATLSADEKDSCGERSTMERL